METMPDIILTHGYFLEEDIKEKEIMRPYPPLGILYVSSYLREQGFSPEIFDSTFATRNNFESMLPTSGCHTLGIYTTHMTRRSVISQIKAAKNIGYTIIVGGPDSAGYPKQYLDHGADFVVIGEGEATLAELLTQLSTNNYSLEDLQDIHGLVFKAPEGQVIETATRDYLDIDSLPWPDRESINIQQYLDAWRSHHGETSLNMINSRGCRFQCRFCSHSVFGNIERRRAPEKCATEVEWIVKQYNPDQLWFSDDVFTMDHDWMLKFSEELKSRTVQISFEAISRADRMQDEQIVKELANMGCRRIWIGSESGSDRMLRAMRRGVTSDQITRAVWLSKKYGIETGIFLMWGYEGETLEDIELTVDHVIKSQPDIFLTTTVHPIRNTPYYYDVFEKTIHPENWVDSSDKDIKISDRKHPDFYKAIDQWLKNAVKAEQFKDHNPQEAARYKEAAEQSKLRAQVYFDE
jgi:anaerobic magnesium-protoporphyrin IX monomethyl ester cyclase